MPLNTVVFADELIVEKLRAHASSNSRSIDLTIAHASDSYEDCLANAILFKANVIILQIYRPVVKIHDFFHSLLSTNLSYTLILFKVERNSQIIFSTTKSDMTDYTGKIRNFFMQSLSNDYTFSYHFIYDQRDLHASEDYKYNILERTNYLNEILRGADHNELMHYRNKAKLKLDYGGYYLYVWDFKNIQFADHSLNKYNYSFLNEEFEKECQEVIDAFYGGEAFFSKPLQLCIIINDCASTSLASRQKYIREITTRLGEVTKTRNAFRSMSGYIKGIEDIRDAYEAHYYLKTFNFFCYDTSILTNEYIESSRKPADFSVANALLKDIRDLINHDIFNSNLKEWIRKLFIDIIKPSLDYNLYQYCYTALTFTLLDKYNKLNIDEFPNIWPQSSLQYTSIAEICEDMIEYIEQLRKTASKRRSLQKSLVMQAIEFIEKNYTEDITVDMISSKLFISSSHLSQLFNKEFNHGLNRYLINYRITMAKELLTTDAEPIYRIAAKVGFSDSKHFSKTFKKITGMSPVQFKKSNT